MPCAGSPPLSIKQTLNDGGVSQDAPPAWCTVSVRGYMLQQQSHDSTPLDREDSGCTSPHQAPLPKAAWGEDPPRTLTWVPHPDMAVPELQMLLQASSKPFPAVSAPHFCGTALQRSSSRCTGICQPPVPDAVRIPPSCGWAVCCCHPTPGTHISMSRLHLPASIMLCPPHTPNAISWPHVPD